MRATTAIFVSTLFPAAVMAAETPASVAAAPTAAAALTPAATGTVARPDHKRIEDREPVGNLTSLESAKSRVYFYSELRNFTGMRITHRWEYSGKGMHEQAFDIGSALLLCGEAKCSTRAGPENGKCR